MMAAIVNRTQRRLAGAATVEVEHQEREVGARQIDRIQSFADRSDLVDFDKNGVSDTFRDAFREPLCIGYEDIVTHELDLLT